MTSSLDAAHVLAATAEQAHRLLRPDATVMLVPSRRRHAAAPGGRPRDRARPDGRASASTRPSAELAGRRGGAPAARPPPGREARRRRAHAATCARRRSGGAAGGAGRAARRCSCCSGTRATAGVRAGRRHPGRALADFAASAAANAQLFERVESLLAQARMRESERAELSRRLVSAEQDERRKLSLFLHDGPLQTLSGVAMMLDAVAEDHRRAARSESALRVLETARERQRTVIRSLRELCFALEPWVLRDQGFVVAMRGARRRDGARPRGLGRARRRTRPTSCPPTTRCSCTRSCARRSRTPSSTPRPDRVSTSRSPDDPGSRLRGASSPTTAPASPLAARRRPAPPRHDVDARARPDPGRAAADRLRARRRAPSCASSLPPHDHADVA